MSMHATDPAGAPRLSRERILRAALDLVEREGRAALSMRRLAQELDVWPMAVYRYFGDKDELLAALVEETTGRISLPGGGGPWRSRLAALLREANRVLRGRPGGLEVDPERALLSPSGLRLSQAGIELLEEAGFARGEAVLAWRSLFAYAVGAARGAPAESERTALAGLSDEQYAELGDVAHDLLGEAGVEGGFEYGLERLLDGLEARQPVGS